MKGKVAGVPLILIVLVALIDIPLGLGMLKLTNDVEKIAQRPIMVTLPTPEPTASVSAQPEPTAVPTVRVFQSVKPTTPVTPSTK